MSVRAAANHQNAWTPANAVTPTGSVRVSRKMTPRAAKALASRSTRYANNRGSRGAEKDNAERQEESWSGHDEVKLLDGGNEFETDERHHRRVSVQSADVESNFDETDRHERRSPDSRGAGWLPPSEQERTQKAQ